MKARENNAAVKYRPPPSRTMPSFLMRAMQKSIAMPSAVAEVGIGWGMGWTMGERKKSRV